MSRKEMREGYREMRKIVRTRPKDLGDTYRHEQRNAFSHHDESLEIDPKLRGKIAALARSYLEEGRETGDIKKAYEGALLYGEIGALDKPYVRKALSEAYRKAHRGLDPDTVGLEVNKMMNYARASI